jgi:hypothetical protein
MTKPSSDADKIAALRRRRGGPATLAGCVQAFVNSETRQRKVWPWKRSAGIGMVGHGRRN